MTNVKSQETQNLYKVQSRRWGGGVSIPEIRLEGKWLDELGFKKGQTIIIKQEQNKLTITLDNGQK